MTEVARTPIEALMEMLAADPNCIEDSGTSDEVSVTFVTRRAAEAR